MEMLTIQVKPASLSHFQEPPFSRNVDVLFFTTFSITSRKLLKPVKNKDRRQVASSLPLPKGKKLKSTWAAGGFF